MNLNFEKDLKISRLEQQIKLLTENNATSNSAYEVCDNRYAKFSMDFTAGELRTLRSMSYNSESDRKFTRTALEFLYRSDPSIRHKSLFGCNAKRKISKTGTVKETSAKMPLSPEKVQILRDLHSERITAARLNESELTLRMNTTYVNQLIATGLSNMQRKNVQ